VPRLLLLSRILGVIACATWVAEPAVTATLDELRSSADGRRLRYNWGGGLEAYQGYGGRVYESVSESLAQQASLAAVTTTTAG
jgi:hypothetical protein